MEKATRKRPCCQTGCPDCPYGFTLIEHSDPHVPQELQPPLEEQGQDGWGEYEGAP